MDFEDELNDVLPGDLPNRAAVVLKSAQHLRMIVEANTLMNLTRITDPREAAVKHVLDSVVPWRLFGESGHVLDAGTGAGFPGIPLAVALPGLQFTLSESTGRKARFVEAAVAALELGNVTVSVQRAEDLCRTAAFDVITARAVAPVSRLTGWLAPAIRKGAVALLYKGPEVDAEIREAAGELKKHRLQAEIAMRYELPDALGARTIAQLTSA
ncbi:MAG: 16S rRNA (guanine(527)-N(7))-methyltransferase RsmG [Acidobacteriota bacterium]|nr:16S rRNA (guanine(527)-N(7))-methyltransferase RsmG [Acidobacteriota bacterium]